MSSSTGETTEENVILTGMSMLLVAVVGIVTVLAFRGYELSFGFRISRKIRADESDSSDDESEEEDSDDESLTLGDSEGDSEEDTPTEPLETGETSEHTTEPAEVEETTPSEKVDDATLLMGVVGLNNYVPPLSSSNTSSTSFPSFDNPPPLQPIPEVSRPRPSSSGGYMRISDLGGNNHLMPNDTNYPITEGMVSADSIMGAPPHQFR